MNAVFWRSVLQKRGHLLFGLNIVLWGFEAVFLLWHSEVASCGDVHQREIGVVLRPHVLGVLLVGAWIRAPSLYILIHLGLLEGSLGVILLLNGLSVDAVLRVILVDSPALHERTRVLALLWLVIIQLAFWVLSLEAILVDDKSDSVKLSLLSGWGLLAWLTLFESKVTLLILLILIKSNVLNLIIEFLVV